jgi:hypothetical protein
MKWVEDNQEKPEQNLLMYLEKVEGRIVLRITDWHVFDYVDDILTEQLNSEHQFLRTEEINGEEVHTILFPKGTNMDELLETLQKLDYDEIQKIHDLSD